MLKKSLLGLQKPKIGPEYLVSFPAPHLDNEFLFLHRLPLLPLLLLLLLLLFLLLLLLLLLMPLLLFVRIGVSYKGVGWVGYGGRDIFHVRFRRGAGVGLGGNVEALPFGCRFFFRFHSVRLS